MQTVKLIIPFVLLAFLTCGCLQTYVSPYKAPPSGYLVVEGYISGNSPTQFNLSRTIPLPGDSAIPMETGAKVQVEGNDNSIYLLTEESPGIYLDSFSLNPTAQYRLRINTTNGESYLSDYAPFKPTPAIDSIHWTLDANGVNIYANTHDPANATRYYQWSYDQTWQYYSAEQSVFIYQPVTNTVVPRTNAQEDYTCWTTASLTNILIASSAKLAQDEIYLFPLVQIPINSQAISVLYSINVRQYALTQDGYNFLALMRSNTESLGSIFDVQPSQPLGGNIYSLNNPNEVVIGYVSAGTVQQQRIFITNSQVWPWIYSFSCPLKDTLVGNSPDAFLGFYKFAGYVPVTSLQRGQIVEAYFSNFPSCVDCRALGGSTQKPAFWPN